MSPGSKRNLHVDFKCDNNFCYVAYVTKYSRYQCVREQVILAARARKRRDLA